MKSTSWLLTAAGALVVGYAFFRPSEGEGSVFIDVPGTNPYADVEQTVTGYVNGVPFDMVVRPVGTNKKGQTQYLRSDAADAWNWLVSVANSEGVILRAGSAFRSWAEQLQLYALYVARLYTGATTALPGKSNHQGGIAVDVADAAGKSLTYDSPGYHWLMAKGELYGFSWSEGGKIDEPWHWIYVG